MLREIPLEILHPSRLQVRCEYNPEGLRLLAESLRREGQLRPIMVRPHPEREGEFEVVFGHRTLLAAKIAGLSHLQARVEEVDDEEVMWIQYMENECREDLSDYERARWLKAMMEKFGYTQIELADRLGRDKSWISRHLRILELEAWLTADNLKNLSEWAVRPIFKEDRSLWPRIAEKIKAHFEDEKRAPTTSEIQDYIWEAKLEAELGEGRPKPEVAEEAEELERELEESHPQGPNVEGAEGKTLESPREFIDRTKTLWPGATDEFIIDSLVSRGLSEEEAKGELEAYRRERHRPTMPKAAEKPETTTCPLCGRRGAEILTLKVKVEELRSFEPGLTAWRWILRELGGHDAASVEEA